MNNRKKFFGTIAVLFLLFALLTVYASCNNSNSGKSYSDPTFTVLWKNYDGAILQKDLLKYGETPYFYGTPQKPSDAQFTYSFEGWDSAPSPVVGDITYTATYSSSKKSYTVIWKNADGAVLQTDILEYGTIPSYNDIPAMSSNAQYTYTFSGWDKPLSAISDDVVFTAKYATSKNRYTVTWKNYDGSVLKIEELEYGELPSYSGTPTKPSDIHTTFVFSGWDKSLSAITGDISYVAQFTSAKIQYTITWKNYDGTILRTTKCGINDIPSYGNDIPSRRNDSQSSYTFSGWSPKIVEATADTTYIATFSKVLCSSFVITYDANGGSNEPTAVNKEKGKSIILSSIIPKNGDKSFIGWSCAKDGHTYAPGDSFDIDANITLYAIWGHKCETCQGEGVVRSSQICSSCSGSGHFTEYTETLVVCSSCLGAGGATISYDEVCKSCNGLGGYVRCQCSCGNAWLMNQTGNRKCSRCGRTVQGTKISNCSACGGKGTSKTTQKVACSACQGRGVLPVKKPIQCTCSSCSGKGTIIQTYTCSTCGGSQKICDDKKTYTIFLKDNNDSLGSALALENHPYILKVPEKMGYTFMGWFDASIDGFQYTDETGVSLTIWKESNNKTLYAHWVKNYYSITYICDSFVDVSDMPHIYTVEDDDINLVTPYRDAYSFAWKMNNKIISFFDTSIAADATIYGIWIPVDYIIEYDYKGGSSNNRIKYNVETSTFTLNNPIRDGYTFIGWTGSNGEEPQTMVTIEKGSQGNLSYVSNWEINPATEAPTQVPTLPITEPPTEPMTEMSTQPITELLTQPVTEPPMEPPTVPPTEPQPEQNYPPVSGRFISSTETYLKMYVDWKTLSRTDTKAEIQIDIFLHFYSLSVIERQGIIKIGDQVYEFTSPIIIDLKMKKFHDVQIATLTFDVPLVNGEGQIDIECVWNGKITYQSVYHANLTAGGAIEIKD